MSQISEKEKLLTSSDNTSHSLANKGQTQVKKTGLFIASLTIVNTIIGGGIVAMPFASYNLGLLAGLFLNIVCVVISQFSVVFLLRAKDLSGYSSYTEIGFKGFGRASIFFINFAILVVYIGMPISYFLIYADSASLLLAHTGLSEDFFIRRRQVLIAILAVLLLYFVLKKQIAEIKIASILAFSAVTTFVIFLIIQFAAGKAKNNDSDKNYWYQPPSIKIFSAIPIILLAYGFLPTFYPVYQSLKEKNNKNGLKMSFIALMICLVVYLVVTFVGIYSFGSDVTSNILENLDEINNVLSYMLLIFFVIISAMHIPVIFYLGKESILIVIDEIRNKQISNEHLRKIEVFPIPIIVEQKPIRQSLIRGSFLVQPRSRSTSAIFDDPPASDPNAQRQKSPAYVNMSNWCYYSITLVAWIFIVGIALLNPDLGFVLGIIGATAVSFLCYIFPAGFYLRFAWGRKDQPTWIKFLGWVYVVFGVIVLFGCNFCNIYGQVTGD